MGAAVMAKSAIPFWEICTKKNTGLQGSTLSGHCMTTGFSPFKHPTCGLLHGTTPCLKLALPEEPSSWLAFTQLLVGIHTAMNILITKQIGGGAQWVELVSYHDIN